MQISDRCLQDGKKITLENEAGQLIKIEHSEILNPDSGDLLEITQRFPFHDQTDYIYVTTDHYVYEPQFSFQGYRYIKISGLKGELNPGQCKSVVLETGLKDTSCFECSDGNINRLIQNAYWSQCGNMISIPTDCPQGKEGVLPEMHKYSAARRYGSRRCRAFSEGG